MSRYNLVNLAPTEILQTFLTSYYNEYQETCRVGSDEYIAATVFTYALTVLFNTLNDSAKQRFLETATGQFLDAIAATYGTARPQGYKASCLVDITMSGQETYETGSVIIKDQSGHKFTNARSFDQSTRTHVVFQAVETGSDYNGIPVGSLNQFEQSYYMLTGCTNITPTNGGVDSSYYNDDEHFREWLKNQIASFAGAGTALAYYGRAMNADSRMRDAYIVQEGDSEFQPGRVRIYILAEDREQVVPIVSAACTDPLFKPICDHVEVYTSQAIPFDQPQTLLVTYERRFTALSEARNNRIMQEYGDLLLSKIGRPWVYAEVIKKFLDTDADGVYASDAVFIGINAAQAAPIYPYTGKLHELQHIRVDTRFIDVD